MKKEEVTNKFLTKGFSTKTFRLNSKFNFHFHQLCNAIDTNLTLENCYLLD